MGFTNIEHRPFQSGLPRHWGARATTTTSRSSAGPPTSRIRVTTSNKLLSGQTIQDVQNNNTAYFNNPTANRLMNHAAG